MKFTLQAICIVFCYAFITSITGCSERADNPTFSAPDTSGNGNGSNDPNLPWILEGPVTYSAGVLQAINSSDQSEDSTVARCTLREAVDFGDVAGVIFGWRESIVGDAEYIFWVGSDTARMMSLIHVPTQGDMQRALLAFQGSFVEPLYSRFVFILPASSSVQIQNYQAESE